MDSLHSQSGRFVDHRNSNGEKGIGLGRTGSPLSKSLSVVSDASSQSLASILNNPHVRKSGVYGSDASWVGWLSSYTAASAPEFAPLAANKAASEVNRSDFQQYLASTSELHNRFEDIREHSSKETVDVERIGGQGESLVACLREVPALYFKEDLELEDGATFRAACPFSTVSENLMLQEKLSQYLDVVELHLVKEISLRSNSFFEAQGQLEELNVKIVEGCWRIRELKETIRLLDSDLVDSALQIQDLNATRSNLLARQQKLRLILNVNQALSALKLLVASADCAGALDVTEDLQHLLDGEELTGLHCFRHLQAHVAASIDTINSILSAEFIRMSLHDVGNMDATIFVRAKERASIHTIGEDELKGDASEVKMDEEEISSFRDRLLPLIIGLLRTGKLPSVLRIYRDALTADMKTAIKTVVAELLPTLMNRHMESDFAPGGRIMDADGGSSLANKLRSLSAESFIQLLGAIFSIVQAHLVRAAEVKKAIECIVCNLDGHYTADSVATSIALGAAVANTAQEADGQIASSLSYSPQRNTTKVPSLQALANDVTGPSISRNFRADVMLENTEAVFAACDAAHGRWAKLLGARAIIHPRLRLPDFLRIYDITQEFITATKKIGGRSGYSIRGTLQSQAKAFVDFQHESRIAKLKAVLDQETWVGVDVPDEFQAIISSLFFVDHLSTGHTDDAQGSFATGYSEVVLSSNGSLMADNVPSDSEQRITQTDSTVASGDNTEQLKYSTLLGPTDDKKTDATTYPGQSNNNYNKECRKASSETLPFSQMVNCGLIFVKMLSEYIEMNSNLPALSPELVHRVVEILKFFNTRTCQLVLGAGAIQVSGLKSITSKHLASACQVVSFIYAIIPEIRRIMFTRIPETRKAMLLLEIDRVAQDYKLHRDEIHTKLVQLMRDRLLVHLRSLPQMVESWNRPDDSDSQPSQFARSLTKEVGYFQRVLSRTMHEIEVEAIFRQVVPIFHSQISEAFSHLDISTPQAKKRLHLYVQNILACIRSLPSDNLGKSGTPNWGQLDELLVENFGSSEAGQ